MQLRLRHLEPPRGVERKREQMETDERFDALLDRLPHDAVKRYSKQRLVRRCTCPELDRMIAILKRFEPSEVYTVCEAGPSGRWPHEALCKAERGAA